MPHSDVKLGTKRGERSRVGRPRGKRIAPELLAAVRAARISATEIAERYPCNNQFAALVLTGTYAIPARMETLIRYMVAARCREMLNFCGKGAA